MMDKNIAALLREDTRTVHVSYDLFLWNFNNTEQAEGQQKTINQSAGAKRMQGGFQELSTKLYTYVTHINVMPGDTVIVEANGRVCLAHVIQVDDEVNIEPNSDITFKWVIDKVDIAAFESNRARNREIERAVGDAYRNNLRRNFAQTIMAGVEDSQRAVLTQLIQGAKK